jgi:hypothetical protein
MSLDEDEDDETKTIIASKASSQTCSYIKWNCRPTSQMRLVSCSRL